MTAERQGMPPTRARRAPTAAIPLVVAAAGIVLVFWPTLSSGFRRLQTDPGDTRFNHYVLEHSFRWARGDALHRRLWDPPFFAPQKNVLAYSDTLLTVAPPYWALRGCGIPAETALALWMMAMAAGTFAAGFGLLRHGLRQGVVASSFGAFVMAFGASRINQLGHQQLLPHFFTITAIHALIVLFTRDDLGTRARRLWWCIFFGCFAAQFYASYYSGFFLFLTLFLASIGCAFSRPLRDAAWKVVRRDSRPAAVAALLSGCALLPLAWHYLQAARDVGVRGPEVAGLARPASFAYMGPGSLLYGWTDGWGMFSDLPLRHEQAVGMGLATTAVTLWFFWSRRRSTWVQITTFVILAVFLFATVFPGRIYLFRVWYYTLPGVQPIRVMARFWILLAIPAGVALAAAVESVRRRASAPVAVGLALLCCAEQITVTESYDVERFRDRVAAISDRLDRSDTDPFFVPGPAGEAPFLSHLDAMWAGLEAGRPTVNGYSGNFPPGYDLYESNAPGWRDRLAAWERSRSSAAVVVPPGGEAPRVGSVSVRGESMN